MAPDSAGIVLHAVVHAVHLGRIRHDHAVDKNAGHAHVLGLQRPVRDDALDLRDHDAAIVVRGHRLGEAVEGERLLLHAEVAGRIGARRADQRHVDGGRLVEQPLAAVEFDELDDVLGRHHVHLASAEPRVHVGMETDLREQSRLARSARTVELGDDALRQVVALDLVLLRGLGDLRHAAEIGGDDAREETLVVEAAGAEPFAVAGAGAHDEGKAFGAWDST